MKPSRRFGIFKCRRCGRLNLAETSRKSKVCAYCGVRNRLAKVRFIAYASTPREASQILRRLKAEKT